jgi:stage III sporulation protein AB
MLLLQWMGSLLVLISGAALGLVQASRFAKRPRELRHLIQALTALETEIVYGVSPLPTAFVRIAGTLPNPVAKIFFEAAQRMNFQTSERSAGICWIESVHAVWPHSAMRAREKETLMALASTLGITDRNDQSKHIRLAIQQLHIEESVAREDQNRYEKMWRSLGILIAVLIVILMY